ncbi:MAG: IS66 family transposase [Gemmatimonadetes bacterium]|nr:IS66 family transposase [Gemmatimonadota bacterium]
MSIVEQLEAAGEVFSPAVRAALLALEARVRELEARLGLDSTNSSKPPSTDPPGVLRRGKKPTGRKRGGQPGHPGAYRALLPSERVDAVVEHRPLSCDHCGHSLRSALQVHGWGRHQVVELPPIRAHVTEHRLLVLACPACARHTRAHLPPQVSPKHFGPRLSALASLLISRFRLSRRDLVAFFSDVLDVPAPGLGTTERFARESAAALRGTYQEIRGVVRRSPSARVDETGWSLRGKTRWLWASATEHATLFHLGRSRSARDLRRLLGRDYGGIVTSDRWSAYQIYPHRQLCWAHLARNFEGLTLRGAPALAFARAGVAECTQLFHTWHQWKSCGTSREDLALQLRPLRARFARLLRRGLRSADSKVAALARHLHKHADALWTFTCEEIEPTNNQAERALRRAVLWRKGCFGSASGHGLIFVERLLTLSETCRQNAVNVLDYLTRAIVAHREHHPAPCLLPAP